MQPTPPLPASGSLAVNVAELNPYAPRPFVFTEAALCLRDSIRACGFASDVLWENQADPQAITIVLGAVPPRTQVVDRLDPRKTIVFNFEQFGSTSALASPQYLRWLRGRIVADYHSHNVACLKREHGEQQRAFELPIVPTVSLLAGGTATQAGQSVDVLFFGTLSERRARIVEQLQARGMTVEVVAGAYAHELTPALRRARIVLHVHYYGTGLFPIARFLQPLMLETPIVCEDSVFSSGSDWSQSGIVFARYEDLAAACGDLLRAPAARQQRAQRSRLFASKMDFETPFRRLLGDVLAGLRQPMAPPAKTLRRTLRRSCGPRRPGY